MSPSLSSRAAVQLRHDRTSANSPAGGRQAAVDQAARRASLSELARGALTPRAPPQERQPSPRRAVVPRASFGRRVGARGQELSAEITSEGPRCCHKPHERVVKSSHQGPPRPTSPARASARTPRVSRATPCPAAGPQTTAVPGEPPSASCYPSHASSCIPGGNRSSAQRWSAPAPAADATRRPPSPWPPTAGSAVQAERPAAQAAEVERPAPLTADATFWPYTTASVPWPERAVLAASRPAADPRGRNSGPAMGLPTGGGGGVRAATPVAAPVLLRSHEAWRCNVGGDADPASHSDPRAVTPPRPQPAQGSLLLAPAEPTTRQAARQNGGEQPYPANVAYTLPLTNRVDDAAREATAGSCHTAVASSNVQWWREAAADAGAVAAAAVRHARGLLDDSCASLAPNTALGVGSQLSHGYGHVFRYSTERPASQVGGDGGANVAAGVTDATAPPMVVEILSPTPSAHTAAVWTAESPTSPKNVFEMRHAKAVAPMDGIATSSTAAMDGVDGDATASSGSSAMETIGAHGSCYISAPPGVCGGDGFQQEEAAGSDIKLIGLDARHFSTGSLSITDSEWCASSTRASSH